MRDRAVRILSGVLMFGAVLAVASPSRAQDTCDVVITLDETASAPIVAYGLDYSAAGGSFMGTGFTPVCTRLFTGLENDVYDDDAGLLSNFVASTTGVPPTQALISCVFALDGGFPCPAPSAFVVTDPVFPPIAPIIDLPPPPNLSIVVTPRTPVCGDGFREGTEACDDGNVADGDCCSSTCALDAASTPCDDGSVCTLNGSCDAVGGCIPASTLVCDDGDPCTTDSCDALLGCEAAAVPAPFSQCEYDTRGAIDLRDEASAAKDKLTWLQLVRTETTPAAVGNPTVDTDYALCLYDEVAQVPALRFRLDVPAGSGWKAVGTSGTRYQYKNKSGSADGVQTLRIDGKSTGVKLQVKAGGTNLPLPGPVAPDRYFARDRQLTVQLRNTAGGCWAIDFRSEHDNTATRYRAKHK